MRTGTFPGKRMAIWLRKLRILMSLIFLPSNLMRSRIDVIRTHQELNNGGFTGPCASEETDNRARSEHQN